MTSGLDIGKPIEDHMPEPKQRATEIRDPNKETNGSLAAGMAQALKRYGDVNRKKRELSKIKLLPQQEASSTKPTSGQKLIKNYAKKVTNKVIELIVIYVDSINKSKLDGIKISSRFTKYRIKN